MTKPKIELTASDRTQQAFRQVEQSFARLQRTADGFSRVMAGLGGVLSAGALTAFVGSAINSAAALDDMAEATGASVEGLSRLTQIARIGGNDVGVIETALVRMNKALSGADEESKGAGAALKALGLSAAELKTASPDQALEKVAQAIAGFEDGAQKTSVALALFGKSGAQLLPVLNDIAQDTQTVGRVTAEQAAAAELLGKAWGRLSVEAQSAGQSIALGMVPALQRLVSEFNDAGRAGIPFFEALRNIGLSDPSKSAGQQIAAITKQIEALQAVGARDKDPVTSANRAGRIGELQRLKEYFKLRQQAEALALGGGESGDVGARPGSGRARLPFLASGGDGGKGKKADDPLKAQREAIEALGQQQEAAANADTEIAKLAQRYRELYDPAAAAINKFREFEEIRPLLADAGLDVEAIADVLRDDIAKAEFGPPLKDMTDELKAARSVADELGLSFSSAFEDAVVGGKNLRGVLDGIGQDILRLLARKVITEPIAGAVSGAFAPLLGGLFSGGGGALPGGGFFSAKGNVFDPSGWVPFARGGVVSRPTVFPFASGIGLMGEAGPEAILPLKRGPGGRLGVEGGAGGGVTVNVIEAPGTKATVSTRQDGGSKLIEVLIQQVSDGIGREIHRGVGAVSSSMERVYGLNRAAGAVR